MNNFRFTRLTKNKKKRFPDLGSIMENSEIGSETWLFVSPHDDDVCIGAGLWLHTAAQAGVNVQILIVTAESGTEDRNRALFLGANSYMLKPVRLDQITSEVLRLFEERAIIENKTV